MKIHFVVLLFFVASHLKKVPACHYFKIELLYQLNNTMIIAKKKRKIRYGKEKEENGV